MIWQKLRTERGRRTGEGDRAQLCNGVWREKLIALQNLFPSLIHVMALGRSARVRNRNRGKLFAIFFALETHDLQ